MVAAAMQVMCLKPVWSVLQESHCSRKSLRQVLGGILSSQRHIKNELKSKQMHCSRWDDTYILNYAGV